MKVRSSLVLLVVLTLGTVCLFAQQEVTLTTTSANTVASRTTIEVSGLAGNPFAIIVATPLGNTATLNSHPIGAWYYNNKWNIHTTDNATMSPGLTFKVQVFLTRDATHFLHVVTLNDLHSLIDNPALNNNPGAQVQIFQNHAPDSRPFNLNPNEAKVYYDNLSGRWYIMNANHQLLKVNTAYNVVIASGGVLHSNQAITQPIGTSPIATLPPQTTTSINGNAGGDLRGAYPNPNVVGLNGRPISNTAPAVGDTLRWNGTAWEPYTPATNAAVNASQLLGRDIMTTAPKVGQVLKFGGGSWYPADDSVGTTSAATPAMQAFYKQPPDGSTRFQFSNSTPATKITILSHTVVLTRESRLVISATVRLYGSFCPVGCSDGEGSFFVRVDGTGNARQPMDFFIPHDKTISVSINSYVRDLDPGTHTIEFWIEHNSGTSGFEAYPMNSSIIVIPL